MLRDFRLISGDPLKFLDKAWRAYGDVVQFPIPKPPTYLVNDLEGVKRVLLANYRNYTKDTIQYRSLSAVTGEGLLTADGESWRRQRPLVQPAFHHTALESVSGTVSNVCAALVAEWERRDQSVPVDCDQAMMQSALAVVGRSLFGRDLSTSAQRLTKATLAALDVVVDRARPSVPLPSWVPTANNRKLRWALGELDGAVGDILADRGSAEPAHPDLVDLLRFARDDSGDSLSQRELRDQIVTFFVAGHETVASAMTWALALLAANPAIQEQLAEQSRAVLGDEVATFRHYRELTLAKAVFEEALRLYPPAWLITRKSLEADELGGREVPADSLIIISPTLLHQHPDHWERPEVFDPSRFVDGNFERTAFIPFGAGLRQCIGKDFAYFEAVLMLSTLASKFRFEFASGGLPAVDPSVTVRPIGGLPLIVRSRS